MLFRLRKRIERAFREGAAGGYVVSLSSRTVVYKGLLLPAQLGPFFPDLTDPAFESALALVHSRFSTNTFPTWPRAHPYRMLCHNGEINTLRGNVGGMRVRESTLDPARLGLDAATLFPVIGAGQSDSACLDNAFELLVRGGRSLAHAAMMLVPEAPHADLPPDVRAFYDYHAALMEPWDGPAAVVFSDGQQVGAVLDRNGLRPARWCVTDDDLVVLASEAGALALPPARIRQKGRLGPGHILLVDPSEGRVLENAEVKARVAAQQPYGAWVEAGRRRLPETPFGVPEPVPGLHARQVAFGYTAEELRTVLVPMAETGHEPIGSMGNDTPLAVLSDRPQPLFRYFKQLFAQVTNPPIDPIRERAGMLLALDLGPRPDVLLEAPRARPSPAPRQPRAHRRRPRRAARRGR